MPKSNGPKFTINEAPHFNDPDKAREFLEAQRWGDGVFCPHCGVIGNSYPLHQKPNSKRPGRKGLYKCGDCRKQFTVTVGTIFEDSKIPLNKWLLAIHLMCSSKKGVSAHQVHRMLGVTYKSAWFMCHRIRYAMTQEPLSSKLSGTVEIDETYIGGKEKGSGRPGMPGPESKKTPVVAMVERSLVHGKGKVRSQAVDRVTLKNIKPVIQGVVSSDAVINTDEAAVYYFIGKEQAGHATVNHAKKEYVRKEPLGVKVTTNTIESYFALIKRGVHGTFHHISKQHLHRYLCEFDFRYNARDIQDKERAVLAIKGVEGKRLMYRDSFARCVSGETCS